jgi:hypothetical protein
MQGHSSVGRHLVEASERVIEHIAAIVVGFVLMIAGVAMGVTIVMLPLGLPIGLTGLFLFMWGLYHRATPVKDAAAVTP